MTEATQGGAIARLCRLAEVSRAGYYRHFQASAPGRADSELRSRVQLLCLADRHLGYRRVARTLKRQGIVANAKRVQRLMREDNLLVQRHKPFVPRTTDSRHGSPVVANLVRGLIPTGLNQIWVADITYIRLLEAFVYLAIILDAFSRRAIGWALEDHLEAALALQALDMAIAARQPVPGSLIHHSDRGVQYACTAYAARLSDNGIAASMSRVGNPYDNAKAESFMKTLKTEEIDGKAYTDIHEARRDLGRFIEDIYNTERLHSALGYRPPIEFENHFAQTQNP